MPVKRRKPKRTTSPELRYHIWSGVFDSGWDFFDELEEIGATRVFPGKPDRAEAQAAWAEFGARYLAEFPGSRDIWALQEFGEPN